MQYLHPSLSWLLTEYGFSPCKIGSISSSWLFPKLAGVMDMTDKRHNHFLASLAILFFMMFTI
jgi:hypothetical protein